MDPVTLAAISGLVSVGGGALGAWLSESKDEQEYQQRMEALRQYASIAPPQHRELIARTVARSAMTDVRRNPALEAAQDEVLARTMEVARGGESAQARAEYEQAALDSAQRARSDRMGAVARAMASGLGPEAGFTDSLMAGQADADRERMAGLQRAASSEAARMGALGSAGSMAASRSGQQFAQDASVAAAQDELNRFNAGMMSDTDRFNRADELDTFNAQLAIADRRAGQHNNIANMRQRQGDRTREQVGNVITGAGRAVMAPGAYGATGAAAEPTAPKPYQSSTYGGVGSQAALDPALEQQRNLQQQPLTTAKTRKAR